MDELGSEISRPRFDWVEDFNYYLAIAGIGDRYFILDTEGREVMQTEHVLLGVQIFSGGYVAVNVDGLWGIVHIGR